MGTTVTVDASGSQGSALQYQWTLVRKPAGSTAAVAGDVRATFVADVEGEYVLRLVVAEGATSSEPDEVTITAATVFTGGAVDGTTAAVAADGDFERIAKRLHGVLATGHNTVNPEVVLKALTTDAVFVLDTREPEDFAKGHIPGAVNVPLRDLPSALLGNPGLIPDKNVVIASYYGGDGNMASFLVNAIRITDPAAQKAALDARQPLPFKKSEALFGGMTSWTYSREVSPIRFDDDLGKRRIVDGAVTTAAVPKPDQGAFPALAAFGGQADELREKILVRAREFLRSVPAQQDLYTDWVKVRALLADGDASNDPLLLSVRSAADWAKGHPATAINIPWQQVANLAAHTKFVPTSRPLAVYCYTAHTGGVATMALGLLGYQGARNVLYGINGYNVSAAIGAGQLNKFDLNKSWEFPMTDADGGPDTLVGWAPEAGCVGCHTSLAAIGYDLATRAIPSVTTAVASEGEG